MPQTLDTCVVYLADFQIQDSTPDSPYRSGRHVPLSNSRHSILTSVATAASESHINVASPYHDESGNNSLSRELSNTSYQGAGMGSPYTPSSPNPYSPGARSQLARRQSQQDGFDMQSPGDVQMQSFQDGLPPAPPVSHSWRKIDAWAEEHYPELYDQLGEGATHNDLNELEHMLDCTLPQDVRESLMVHDGQERWGTPTGIIFGSMLLDCEEMVQEWETWRKVNQQFLLDTTVVKPAVPSKALGGSSEASSSKAPASPRRSAQNPNWRQDLIARQDCVPPNAVQRAYAHPAWIPLVRDWGGNNLAVDLAPGPSGTWGQIILFGRDYDTKYVIAKSWAHLLAIVADDLNSGKWFVDEDSGELKLREFKETRVEPPYFGILRWRTDQKYGRRAARRRSAQPPNRTSSPAGSSNGSPYTSPTAEPANGEPRGRTLQRPNGASPLASPIRPGLGKPSPLGIVAEESAMPEIQANGTRPPKLVEVDTPRPSEDSVKLHESPEDRGKENAAPHSKINGKLAEVTEEPLKEIEI